MDEIKELINSIAHLPQLTVWILCGFLVYKIVVIGSIYGVIRFAIDKFHDWAVNGARRVRYGNLIIDNAHQEVEELLREMRINTQYVHASDVKMLRKLLQAAKAKGEYK